MNNKRVVVRTDKNHWKMSDEEIAILKSINSKVFMIELPQEIENYNNGNEIFNAEAIIVSNGYIQKKELDILKNLRIVSRMGTGVDKIDLVYATKLGIVVSNTPDFCVNEVADHVMAMLLALNRRLFLWDASFRKCTESKEAWEHIKNMQNQGEHPIRIAGNRLGLIGFGNIARMVSIRAKSFQLEVWAYDPYVSEEVFEKYGVKKASMNEIFKNCEFVSVHIPLNKDTYHLIDKKYFKLMKPKATFINTARGGVIAEEDLILALKEKWIWGAGIDVFENFEVHGPNVCKIDSLYFKLDNVILTPHIAVNSDKSFLESQKVSANNIVDALTGYWPKYVVNKEVVPKYPLNKKYE